MKKTHTLLWSIPLLFGLGLIAIGACQPATPPAVTAVGINLAAFGLITAILAAGNALLKLILDKFVNGVTWLAWFMSASNLTSILLFIVSIFALVKGHEITLPPAFVEMLIGTIVTLLALFQFRKGIRSGLAKPAGPSLPQS